jgi:p-aminobenzoyl-glutamate transporter AbgT
LGDLKGPYILGYPWWLSVSVVVVFAVLLWYVFDGWVRPLVRVLR